MVDTLAEADRNFSSLSTVMADEFDRLINAGSGYGNIFVVQKYVRRFPSDPYARYLDWSWMLSNPGQ